MNDDVRLKENLAAVDTITARLHSLRDNINVTRGALMEHAVKIDKERNLAWAMVDQEMVEDHWDSLIDYISFAESLVRVGETVKKHGDIKPCKEALEQLKKSIAKWNSAPKVDA